MEHFFHSMLSKPRPWPEGIMERKRSWRPQREDVECMGPSLFILDFNLEKEFENSVRPQRQEESLHSFHIGVLGGSCVEE